MIRILHIINNLASGGAEKLLEELVPLMNKNENIESDILLLTDQDNVFYDSLISKGVNVDVITYRSLYHVRNIFEIKKHIISGGYDIVHTHTFPTQMWTVLARLLLRNKEVKFFTTEHSTHNRRREKFYLRPLDMFIYSQYDSIISITEKTREKLIDWINPKRIHLGDHIVIENGVDIEKIKGALPYKKSELIEGICDHTKLVCMVGRFTEAKDQPTLIRAMCKIPRDFHLVLVGEGPLLSDNKKLSDQLGLSDRVHFLGFRQDIPRILKTVNVVVLSSYWEGLSLASIEGLASGNPFIASRVPGLEEIVAGYGILFEQGDSDQLAEAINRLAHDKFFYHETTQKCLHQAEKYELENTNKKLLDLYQQKIKP